ncbi:MAG: transcription termination/antitermination protein NusG [Oscillospiraceae bacterium]|nr:transcription termination/antitermination protein NusG [Oscillospiraceae bacterium]
MEDNAQAKWYVAHTYSGYENKVKQNIEKVVENRRLQDMIQEVRIPLETTEETEAPVEEEEGGRKRKKEDNKLFPSYVLIKMVMTDDTWYIVRNTRGVTGFVGPGSKPVPLSDKEVAALGVDFKKVSEATVGFKVGDTITVTGGPFNGWLGSVTAIDMDNQTADIVVSMFGRETPATIAISQLKKLED